MKKKWDRDRGIDRTRDCDRELKTKKGWDSDIKRDWVRGML
jgi:hypothetical protein